MDGRRCERQQRESWFSEKVNPLMSEMVEALVMERPDNPRAWIADYMDQGRDSDAAGTGAGSTGSVGGDGDDEGRRGERPKSSTKSGSGAAASTTPLRPPTTSAAVAATDTAAATGEASSRGEKAEVGVEADTEDPEDVPDLNALLLPGGALPLDVERFGVSYSTTALAGWVKQGSPCCAAASLAGAWNSLGGRPRGAPGALDSDAVLTAMRAVVGEQIADMVSRFERLLQGSLKPLVEALSAELALEGKHLGGRGSKAAVANSSDLRRLTRFITLRERERAGHDATFDLLWDLYEEERKEAADAAEAEAAAATGTVPAAKGKGREDGEAEEEEEEGVGLRNAHVEGAESEVSPEEAGRTSADATAADAKEAGTADKIPRRPSTGHSRARAGGVATTATIASASASASASTSADASAERGLWRTATGSRHSTGDLASARGGDGGAWEGAKELASARPCWEKKDAAAAAAAEEREEEDDEEDEEDDEDGPEEREGPEGRRRSSVGVLLERGGRRRKSSKGLLAFRRSSGVSIPAPRWKWKKDLCALLKRMGGLNKLCMAKPSTGCIGNLGMISTVRYLDGRASGNVEVTARLFMGKGKRRPSAFLRVPLSARDDEEVIAEQWAALREAFMADRQVLLFHLTNHYALIFALREWRTPPAKEEAAATAATATGNSGNDDTRGGSDAATPGAGAGRVLRDDGKWAAGRGDEVDGGGNGGSSSGGPAGGGGWTRQILTARRGQRPSEWMDFQEARKILLGWKGYKVLAVKQGEARGSGALATVTRRTTF